MIFTASDGKTFEDRAAWRLYEFELTYTFRNQKNETLMKLPGQIEGQPFDISDLEGCTVMLLDHINQVQIDNLSNCRVFVGPSSEAVFVRNCTNCVFTIACKQLRTRDCSSCSIYLYSLTDPIIETSQQITFAPFNGAYCGIERNFTDAHLEPANNHWSQVYDFNDPDKSGVNWRILKQEEEAAPWVVDIESQVPGAATSLGACVNPVARDSGFIKYTDSSSSTSGGMQSFTFNTSQKEATEAVQANTANAPVAPSIPAPPQPSQSQSLPVAPTTTSTPAPPAPVDVPKMSPPAPVKTSSPPKQATIAVPEHVAPPPAMPPVLPPVEDTDMATKGNNENPVRTARLRKWYARAWWVGIHVYGYVVLGVKGALSPQALPTAQFVVYLVVAATTIACYVVLQCSSPGQLDKRPMLAPVQTATPTDGGSPAQFATEDGDDTELLGDGEENEHQRNSADLHFCSECHVFQPLRTKHWDCGRCTRQYDHQYVQSDIALILEGAAMMDVTSIAFSEGEDVNDWFKINALYIVLWFMLMCVLLIVVPLFFYQAYLVSTNQTSWEHARRSSITYLQNLPDKRSPFNRGIFQNCPGNWTQYVMVFTSAAFNAVLVLVSVAAAAGTVLLLAWIRAPIVAAKRLAEELDPPQEATYQDPSTNKLLPFGSLGDEKAEVSLTVVIPAYNEEDRILVTIKDTVAFLDEKKKKDVSFSYEIIVVDDCSVDKTVDVVMKEVQKHSVDRIRLLRLQKNHGKGGAIRKGVMRARGERVLFADADNATEIRDYDKLANVMDEASKTTNSGVVICGSRAHLEEQAIAKRHPLRNLLMHGFHLIVSTLCIKNVRDTQCGFKLFDRTASRVLFAPMHIERWAFDVELLYLAATSNMTIKEVAVQWTEVPGSKLSVISATITMLREIILIRLCYTVGIWKINDGGFRLAKRS
ncbi:Putative dolichyl-phosphate beta-glucosyltransferase [Phytophthora palmivora]|uniref:Dolichyl-phosphate beta-glucosyltransferase n=1 Tax=Phytophthora palmivora TaxID=4796 RepID=A0A2P4XVN9_9STRA|nr:Putative dolichyl-phosphate beta-glucosyltransferase [Phytophthora palmivora]